VDGEAGKQLDYEGVANLLASLRARSDCPFCDAKPWRTYGELANLLVALPTATFEGEILSAGGERGVLSCFVLVCANCGFVRLHSRDLLEEKAQERGDS